MTLCATAKARMRGRTGQKVIGRGAPGADDPPALLIEKFGGDNVLKSSTEVAT